jgi:mono/diheme cytochrome c family protein
VNLVRNKKTCLLGGLAVLTLAGCNTDMWVQPKTEPLRASEFYADGASARPLVPGTIAQGHLRVDEGYFTGQTNGKWLKDIPMPVTMELLKRGQDRFNIYCVPCHGRLGDGNGMIANRGFELRRPVGNYHTDRLRNMPAGHFYDVITNGYGAMFSYASRVEPQDRWAIVAYIRALQLAHHANAAQAQKALEMMPQSETPKTSEEGAEH